jgi:hypothetical protein
MRLNQHAAKGRRAAPQAASPIAALYRDAMIRVSRNMAGPFTGAATAREK